MQMNVGEILRRYDDASDKRQQVNILANMNDIPVQCINLIIENKDLFTETDGKIESAEDFMEYLFNELDRTEVKIQELSKHYKDMASITKLLSDHIQSREGYLWVLDFMMRMNCTICRNIPTYMQSASDERNRMTAAIQ